MRSRVILPGLLLILVASLLVTAKALAQDAPYSIQDQYVKSEHTITMRDGVRLFTVVYAPREASGNYPILLKRTPYSCGPYGEDQYARSAGQVAPSQTLLEEGYIFACQDVRGRFMSEGLYDNMRPHVPGDDAIDESSDTYDTVDWLINNIPRNNGKVGMWGISYPGFYAAAALPEAHPALVASSPQAPISDFFFDDFHHHGAYLLSYFLITPVFGYQTDGPTAQPWFGPKIVQPGTRDGYKFYMDLGPLKNADQYYGEDNFFWQQLVEHPNYDEFWQKRSILPHLHDVDHAVMTVGGWFDAEDLYGPLNIYRALERNNPDAFNILVMGPWSHGDWARNAAVQKVSHIAFGDSLSQFYQTEVEAPFFNYFLKGEGAPPSFEALTFDTGRKVWQTFDVWPPAQATPTRYYLHGGETLATQAPQDDETPFTAYVSDPNEPVPYTDETRLVFTPRSYMADDQRFAERRPDVIEFQTDVLADDVTFAGDMLAHLFVATTGTDADFVVKLIDVYPDATPNGPHTPEHIQLGGYQQMVRSEVMRGRFRNSYEHPEPFVPGEVAEVKLPLQDVLHTFKQGHRIMVQIQSTWFPLIDRNPQTYVDNIFKADEADFVKATHQVYHAAPYASFIEVKILPESASESSW